MKKLKLVLFSIKFPFFGKFEMKHSLVIIILTIFCFSCEEQKEKEMACSEMEVLEARMPLVTNKFDREPSRANCDAIVNLTKDIYYCMSDRPKKDRMKANIENMESACNSNLIFFNQ